MPISNNYDRTRNIVFTKVQGILYVGDLLEHFNALEEDLKDSSGALHVVDFSEMSQFAFSIRIADVVPEAYKSLIAKGILRGTLVYGINENAHNMQGMFSVIRHICGSSDIIKIMPGEVSDDQDTNMVAAVA